MSSVVGFILQFGALLQRLVADFGICEARMLSTYRLVERVLNAYRLYAMFPRSCELLIYDLHRSAFIVFRIRVSSACKTDIEFAGRG